MKADDVVDLVYVTQHNFLYAYGIPRWQASDLIDQWHQARELTRRGSLGPNEPAVWLRAATFIGRYRDEDNPDRTFAHYAIGAEHVLGMYVKEREQNPVQERYTKAMEKVARAMDKGASQGDEWKGDD